MITPLLEQLIGRGEATTGTWTFGGSGVSTIQVPHDQVLIIHHFDYFYFCDFRGDTIIPGASATSTITIVTDAGFTLTWSEGGNPATAPVGFNPADPTTTAIDFNTQLSISYPGFFLAFLSYNPGTTTWFFGVGTPAPGAVYNGIVPVTVTPAGVVPVITPFAGGTPDVVSQANPTEIRNRSEHIIEFRSKNSRNHFAVRSKVVFDYLPDLTFTINVDGYYSKDCYMPHLENVQVDIWSVPQPNQWSVIFSSLPNISNESRRPVGYGIGAAGSGAVRQIIFQPLFLPNEKYLPLTTERDDLPPGQVHDQFRPDMSTNRALLNPTANSTIRGNHSRYPLVNVDYVLISAKNYSKYFKGSI